LRREQRHRSPQYAFGVCSLNGEEEQLMNALSTTSVLAFALAFSAGLVSSADLTASRVAEPSGSGTYDALLSHPFFKP
jgi:hypothetical protein